MTGSKIMEQKNLEDQKNAKANFLTLNFYHCIVFFRWFIQNAPKNIGSAQKTP